MSEYCEWLLKLLTSVFLLLKYASILYGHVCVHMFTGRPWPLAFGAGVGVGMGFSNCQHDFMYPDLHHGRLKKVTYPIMIY